MGHASCIYLHQMLIEFPHTDFCIFKFWNYCLQQVLVDFPRPDSLSKENFYEDTMLLLQMIRDKRQKENQEKKDAKIRAMALEQKKRNAICRNI